MLANSERFRPVAVNVASNIRVSNHAVTRVALEVARGDSREHVSVGAVQSRMFRNVERWAHARGTDGKNGFPGSIDAVGGRNRRNGIGRYRSYSLDGSQYPTRFACEGASIAVFVAGTMCRSAVNPGHGARDVITHMLAFGNVRGPLAIGLAHDNGRDRESVTLGASRGAAVAIEGSRTLVCPPGKAIESMRMAAVLAVALGWDPTPHSVAETHSNIHLQLLKFVPLIADKATLVAERSSGTFDVSVRWGSEDGARDWLASNVRSVPLAIGTADCLSERNFGLASRFHANG